MKIVVTGALGHIGSQLIRELPARFPGAGIVMVDNMLVQRYCSLFNLPAGGNYRFIEDDVMKMDLEALVTGASAVVHLAAIANAAASFDNAAAVEEVNYEGAKRMAQACARTGVPMVYLSTTSVYGTQEKVVDENCRPDELQPQSPYAESKLRGEQYLAELGGTQGLRFVTCRFGTIFGTSIGMRFHTAVNKFCWQAVMGQPITVWKTAYEQKRPYLDLEDGVAALCHILDKQIFDRQVYNVLTVKHDGARGGRCDTATRSRPRGRVRRHADHEPAILRGRVREIPQAGLHAEGRPREGDRQDDRPAEELAVTSLRLRRPRSRRCGAPRGRAGGHRRRPGSPVPVTSLRSFRR
jgi:nucleoside-diphosphate-sugar epimerase